MQVVQGPTQMLMHMHADSDVSIDFIDSGRIDELLHGEHTVNVQRSLFINVGDRQAEAGMMQVVSALDGMLTCHSMVEDFIEKGLVISRLQIIVESIRRSCQAYWNAALV